MRHRLHLACALLWCGCQFALEVGGSADGGKTLPDAGPALTGSAPADVWAVFGRHTLYRFSALSLRYERLGELGEGCSITPGEAEVHDVAIDGAGRLLALLKSAGGEERLVAVDVEQLTCSRLPLAAPLHAETVDFVGAQGELHYYSPTASGAVWSTLSAGGEVSASALPFSSSHTPRAFASLREGLYVLADDMLGVPYLAEADVETGRLTAVKRAALPSENAPEPPRERVRHLAYAGERLLGFTGTGQVYELELMNGLTFLLRTVNGQPPLELTGIAAPPPQIGALQGVLTDLAGGTNHTCAALRDGTARCWGNNIAGQLGTGTTVPALDPQVVVGLNEAISVVAGDYVSCALLRSGRAKCWGFNGRGSLGNGTMGMSAQVNPTPVEVLDLDAAVQLSARGEAVCALVADRTVHCWGRNDVGQLGDGTAINRTRPVPVRGLTDVAQVAAGRDHGCAVTRSKQLWCWGANDSGQLGDGTTERRLEPVPVTGVSDAVSVAVYDGLSCALAGTGAAWCWGQNTHGQIGDGSVVERHTPTRVVGRSDFVQLAVGDGWVCGRVRSGQSVCWGDNSNGQLGLGDATVSLRLAPGAPVEDLAGATHLTAGRWYGCALVQNQHFAKCWGQLEQVQLAPVLVVGLP